MLEITLATVDGISIFSCLVVRRVIFFLVFFLAHNLLDRYASVIWMLFNGVEKMIKFRASSAQLSFRRHLLLEAIMLSEEMHRGK